MPLNRKKQINIGFKEQISGKGMLLCFQNYLVGNQLQQNVSICKWQGYEYAKLTMT